MEVCLSTTTLGETLIMDGDLVTAKALLEGNLVRARQLADMNAIGWTLNHFGHLAQVEGLWEQARQLHEASLPAFAHVGARYLGYVWANQSLGEIALAQGDAPHALAHLGEALAAAQDMGDRAMQAWLGARSSG